MSLIRYYVEGKLPVPFNLISIDGYPSAIKKKILFIESLIEDAILFSKGKETFPEKMAVESFFNVQEDERQDKIIEILLELFGPTFSKDKPNFDVHISNIKNRADLTSRILLIINEEQPELAQRIFVRMNEIYKQPSKHPKKELRESLLHIERIKLMAQPEYEPGQEIDDLIKSLIDLLSYWLIWPLTQKIIGFGKANGDDETTIAVNGPIIDLSLAKIAYHLGMKMEHIRYYGRREQNRGVNSGEAKKAQNTKPIINAFRSLDFPKEVFPKGRVNLHKVASMIREHLKSKNPAPPPDIKTITNYLKADKDIWKLFKEEWSGKRKFIFMEIQRQ